MGKKNKKSGGHGAGKPKEEALELQGTVIEAVRDGFRVQLEEHPSVIYCKLAGALRRNFIRVVPGDSVKVEVSPYDLTVGRIVYRVK
ncbi:MAG: translation initiation factor IF-1 [Crenarchaeota archaeon]|nr:MAG: translation initiation factor IF-1 [Thermoproteota archaeon]